MARKGLKAGLPSGAPAQKILPEGMNNKRARAARTIKDHPEVVAKIKAQARKNEDIPTKIEPTEAQRKATLRDGCHLCRGETWRIAGGWCVCWESNY